MAISTRGRRRCRGATHFLQSTAPTMKNPSHSRRRQHQKLPPTKTSQRIAMLIGVSFITVVCGFALQAAAFVPPTSTNIIASAARSSGVESAQQDIGRRVRARTSVLMNERRGLWPTRPPIDLRSDTVTQPTAGMRKAMHKAEVGDDVLGEDPTVKKLETETAEILGKEAALFVPSGTMANLICYLVWCSQRGSEMILGDQSHSFLWEQANAAQFGGIGYRPLKNLADGTIDLNQIEAAVRGNNPCFPVSRLVSIENTHAQCGGKVLPIEYLDDLGALAQEEGLRVHMDGARLWNAAEASRLPPARIVAGVDSVSVCFSKGLGAPVGSVVAGSADFISRAHRVRKALGGGMRQSGVIAAAALEGLRKQLSRLGDDHMHAKKLAQGFQDFGVPRAVKADPASVQSNIVLVDVGPDLTDSEAGMSASVVCDRLREKGVLAMAIMPGTIRFVTHSQVSTQDIQRTVAMMKEVLEEAGLQNVGLKRSAAEKTNEGVGAGASVTSDNTAINHQLNLSMSEESIGAPREFTDALNGDENPVDSSSAAAVAPGGVSRDGGGEDADPDPVLSRKPGVYDEDLDGDGVGVDKDAEAGVEGGDEKQVEEEEEEPSPYLHSFEEVQLQGMTVSNEGFVAVMSSKESGRALRLIMTPDDPMSGGLDVEEAETSEARTLLQLMQGIDMARHLPSDALGSLMEVPMSSGVQLATVCVVDARPFSATLTAKIPQRDSESVFPSSHTSFPYTGPTDPAASAANTGEVHDHVNGNGAAMNGHVQAEQAGIVSVMGASKVAGEGGGGGGEGMNADVSPGGDKEGGSPGSGPGRPRLGVSKEAISRSSFEAFGLALRYPASKMYVRTELLAPGGGIGDPAVSFDAIDVPDLYPGLVKLVDAKSRRSAADEMDAQFEVARIRQQLESAMNAGDSDRINSLREQLNKLVVSDADTANV